MSKVIKQETKKQGIGDIASNKKGSGARYNDGKPDMSLIPITLLAESFTVFLSDFGTEACNALRHLGNYQRASDDENALWNVINELGIDGWEEAARVFTYGKEKYASWNWAKGMPWSVPLASATRHLIAMAHGELADPESGLPHRGHVFCNLIMLLTYRTNYKEGNDLPPPGLL